MIEEKNPKPIAIFGAGGLAREVYFLLERLGYASRVEAFYESEEYWHARRIWDIDVRPAGLFESAHSRVVIAIGGPAARRKIVSQLSGDTEYITLIDPSVIISPRVTIGEGSILCAGTVVTTEVLIGQHVHIDRCVNVGHDCMIDGFSTIAPGAIISGNCSIGAGAYIGAGACIRERITIGEGATVGMGATVIRPVPDQQVHAGNPARQLLL